MSSDASNPPNDLSESALSRLRDRALAAISAAADLDTLNEVRTNQVSGRSAALSLARRALGSLPGPERAEPGKRLNALTAAINQAFEARAHGHPSPLPARCHHFSGDPPEHGERRHFNGGAVCIRHRPYPFPH